MLGSADRPTAIIAYEAEEALTTIRAAESVGLSIPRDLSIIAFHPVMVEGSGLAVTTMIHDSATLSAEAVRMIEKKIDSPTEKLPSVSISFQSVAGISCGPPAD
jgi:LacI family transcriptional regulator